MTPDTKLHYTVPRPRYPVAARVLAVVVVVALLGLGGVAFSVFSVIDHWAIALAFAVVIELGAISEALAILRRNKPAYIGLGISILVSGVYNYTRGAQVNATLAAPLGDLELWALAIGPLSATLFLALTLGNEVARHEQRLADWQEARQRWNEDRERLEYERQVQLQAMQNEENTRVQLAQIAAQERADKRAARVQLRAIEAQTSADAQHLHNGAGADGADARGSFEDYRAASFERNGSGPMKPAEIMITYGVSRRTAYNWQGRLEEEHPELFQPHPAE